LSYAKAGTITQVKLPFDGHLVGMSRNSDASGVRYTLTFEHPCGVQLKLDRLSTLSNEFATAIAKTNLEAGSQLQNQALLKAGTVVATAIEATTATTDGSSSEALDIGVYDLRQPNKIAQNAAWASLHADDRQQAFYGVCWLTWLPRSDASRTQSLLLKLPKSDLGASDYCSDAPGGNTLSNSSTR
jgi:hypothetical protein